METVKRTNRDILRFINVAQAWQQQDLKTNDAMTGFKYAISRVLKSTTKASEDYQERLTEINIDAAATDEKGHILTGPQGTIFGKAESKKRNSELRKLMDEEVEIGVYFAKIVPKDLTEFQLAAFEGFVIPEPPEP